MKNRFDIIFVILIAMTTQVTAQLIPVASSTEVWNGVTTSDDGRIFVCFPRIEGDAGMRIGEVKANTQVVPYPDASWNDWKPGLTMSSKFVRTNSLRIGPDGNLWVVDTGTPKMGENPLHGAAKLVAIDIHANHVVLTIPLDPVMRDDSFIDDLRIYGNYIYLTDAGHPALIVMDKTTGQGRRVLEKRLSTTDQIPLIAEGKVMKLSDGNDLLIHADQLEISPDGKILYFQPASGPMYKIETAYLHNPELTDDVLEKHVVRWFQSPTTGGTAIDKKGNIYISDVNHSSIIKVNPDGKSKLIIRDSKLLWGDALWIDNEGFLWIPDGQLNRLAVFQNGKSSIQPPLYIYKLQVYAKPFRS